MRGVFYVTLVIVALLLADACCRWTVVADNPSGSANDKRLRLAAKTTAAACGAGAIAIGVYLLARLGL